MYINLKLVEMENLTPHCSLLLSVSAEGWSARLHGYNVFRCLSHGGSSSRKEMSNYEYTYAPVILTAEQRVMKKLGPGMLNIARHCSVSNWTKTAFHNFCPVIQYIRQKPHTHFAEKMQLSADTLYYMKTETHD